MQPTLMDLLRQAGRLKASGQTAQALNLYRQAQERFPAEPVAQHNLAAALGDLGRHDEALVFAKAALDAGLDAPETWLVRARSELGLLDLVSAAESYRRALALRPNLLAAQFEAAQLAWMSSGDTAQALRGLRQAEERADADPMLAFVKAQALEMMGDEQGARASLEPLVARAGCPPAALAYAAHLEALLGRPHAALSLAEACLQTAPGDFGAVEALTRARLAVGDGPGASEAAGHLVAAQPMNQHAIALQATAWRLMGDARYRELYDYERLVASYPLGVPSGWDSLEAYVADVANELRAAHPFRAHPFGHSVRGGSQLPHLLSRNTPALSALAESVMAPIRRHLERLGRGDDAVRRRNTGRVRIQGDWSVWLWPSGHHVDHVHQEGWLSTACHIELPAVVGAGGREGWLRFGKPGIPVSRDMEAEHWARPEPGRLVLFPSYMWHGTEPFSGEMPRLTVAFDLLPA
ncbi:putative 2OG-Fe(II) oxygenase [Roseateles sp. DC23W]|uniref:2OG-Fe(II) oxygenase n=1 Tax=Pelomonas dachongensis TaxID=3299029 RepID=A0ABW7ENL6_9BURK